MRRGKTGAQFDRPPQFLLGKWPVETTIGRGDSESAMRLSDRLINFDGLSGSPIRFGKKFLWRKIAKATTQQGVTVRHLGVGLRIIRFQLNSPLEESKSRVEIQFCELVRVILSLQVEIKGFWILHDPGHQ